MLNAIKLSLLLIVLLSGVSNAQVSITSDSTLVDNSAMLEVQSTDKGILIPRMNSNQRELISSPATGLLLYQTDGQEGFYYYNGVQWVSLNSSSTPGNTLIDNDADTKIQVEATSDDDMIRFAVQGNEAMVIDSNSNVGIGTSAPKSSAIMEVNSTTKGFLPPRMTEQERDSIPDPAAGLIIYCTNCLEGRFQKFDGSEWKAPESTAMFDGKVINGESTDDKSGWSVSLSGDGKIVAIGATENDGNGANAGHVRIYQYSEAAWAQKGDDIDGEAAGDLSGSYVSLSSDGSTVAIGARRNDGNGNDAGHVRIYQWSGTAWDQLGDDIEGEAASDFSGRVSLSSDGSTVAIGADWNDGGGNNAGHVRVYKWQGSSWIKQGMDLDGAEAFDYSGYSVALSSDGTIVAIGAITTLPNGYVKIYEWDGLLWQPKGNIITGNEDGSGSGSSVALSSDGSVLAIGASGFGSNPSRGYVRIYQWDANTSDWIQRGAVISGERAGDASGQSVSLSSDGNIVAIGADRNDDGGNNAGHVRIYQWQGNGWVKLLTDLDGGAAFDIFGYSVSLSSDGAIVAAGAPGFSSDKGQVKVAYSLPSIEWSSLADVPPAFQDGVDNSATWSTLEGLPAGFADNVDNVDSLGNHTATMDLDMNNNDIVSVNSMNIWRDDGINDTDTGTKMYKQLGISHPDAPSYIWYIGHQLAVPSSTDDDLYFYVERGSTSAPEAKVAGYIQDSGSGQMNFTGQHRSLVLNVDYTDPEIGKEYEGLIVVADQSQYLGMSGGLHSGKEAIMINEALPVVTLSSKAKDKRVYGVISSVESEAREDAIGAFGTPYSKEKGDQRMYINSVGEGGIWIIDDGGSLESGDYIQSSSVPGYGMKQNGPSVHNYTVAKITMDCDFAPETITKERIQRMAGTEYNGTPEQNALDSFGRIIWEPDIDNNGRPILTKEYEIRYLRPDGTQLSKDDYVQLKNEGYEVFRAAFVGCTYHCG